MPEDPRPPLHLHPSAPQLETSEDDPGFEFAKALGLLTWGPEYLLEGPARQALRFAGYLLGI